MSKAQIRIWQSARCCGHTRQRWRLIGRQFQNDGETCAYCGNVLQWGNETRSITESTKPEAGRIDLGLELARRHLRFGDTMTHREIAQWCGCSRGLIWLIEQRAMRKLRRNKGIMKLLQESGHFNTP